MAEFRQNQDGQEGGSEPVNVAGGNQLDATDVTDTQAAQQQQQLNYKHNQMIYNEPKEDLEEVVQVVYQSALDGSLVGVESTSLVNKSYSAPMSGQHFDGQQHQSGTGSAAAAASPSMESVAAAAIDTFEAPQMVAGHQQLSRAGSTLPSVAEELTSGVLPLIGEISNSPIATQDDIVAGPNSLGLDYLVNYLEPDSQRDAPGGGGGGGGGGGQLDAYSAENNYMNSSNSHQQEALFNSGLSEQENAIEANYQQAPIYSTINRHRQPTHITPAAVAAAVAPLDQIAPIYSAQQQQQNDDNGNSANNNNSNNIGSNNSIGVELSQDARESAVYEQASEGFGLQQGVDSLGNDELINYNEPDHHRTDDGDEGADDGDNDNEQQQRQQEEDLVGEAGRISEEISQILVRQKAGPGPGPVEKGSFRNNFRKKLGLSVSTNENDLTAYRQKFIESVQDDSEKASSAIDEQVHQRRHQQHLSQQQAQASDRKFKRNNSVSFNVNSSRSNRHSVDIRNLPSYLTHKRASIVDVARGAMSSLISSLGGGGGGGGGVGSSSAGSAISSGGHRRDSMGYNEDDELDNEPIFEEPIAPTLSLGQRVAMVRNSGTEFGTVGWIGQLADFDDDWIVGVIFDNMIGDCDGAYRGTRYFYARNHYAMFVPLSALIKTDNYIGRPETGTVLSRMSVALKPGQLISIQRSSIRLQHCFLNAPHQRVGHDVRAVSNRLHCQCHNCGPCAHLTKQGRPSVLPHFGAHHLPHRKKNSLAHAAVEMLAHHHHHFHEEEEHDEKDYEFGDNAAHACNYVRYSCCQQNGSPGHEFFNDCGMVRPELLDNLIHAPKAPHRRTRPRRTKQKRQQHRGKHPNQQTLAAVCATTDATFAAIESDATGVAGAAVALANVTTQTNTLETNKSTTLTGTQTNTSTLKSSMFETSDAITEAGHDEAGGSHSSYSLSASCSSSSSASASASSSSSSTSSPSSSRSSSASPPPNETRRPEHYNYYQYDTSSFRPQNNVFQTVNSQVSIVDQQRFVYRRDSSAFAMQSPRPSNWSEDGDSFRTTSGFGKRFLRCLGCLKRRAGSRRRRPRRRKLSFKDRVLEYRRRQSTFVPSTLAKPHEDFASHGIVMSSVDQTSAAIVEVNSDYSSCSKSSSCSSRSNSPSTHYRPDHDFMAAGIVGCNGGGNANINNNNNIYAQQRTTVTMEHGYPATNNQLKSAHGALDYNHMDTGCDQNDYKRQLNYGDFNFSDGYDSYKKNEQSKDSALTDFAYSDTNRTNSSSDTLKFLVDQSINEQVIPLQPMHEIDIVSPISSIEHRGNSAISDQVDVSSPTASAIDHEGDDEDEEQLSQRVENIMLSQPEPDQGVDRGN